MATTYTPKLALAKPTQGELDGSWGTVVNDNITTMIEEAIAGYSTINSWSTNSHTLTTANGTTAESRAAMLSLTDTGDQLGTNAATVICPAISKIYVVKNAVGQAATLKTASGTGIAIPNGTTSILFCDGTNVLEAITNVTGTLTTAAITASGAITSTGDITAAGTLLVTGDTAAGDDAAMGYTSAEGLILTGQGSTNDVTIKNDADADVIEIPTGTTQVDMAGDVTVGDDLTLKSDAAVLGFGADTDTTLTHVADTGVLLNSTRKIQFNDASQFIHGSSATVLSVAATDEIDLTATAIDINGNVDVSGTSTLASVDVTGVATAATFEPDGDTAAGDNAAIGYTAAEGLILTGQGSTNDVTIKNDADADVIEIPTGTQNVTMQGTLDVVGDLTAGTFTPDGDTAAGDSAAIGYTAAEGLILTGQGSTNDVTIKNDADADVIEIPTGTQNVTMAGTLGVTGLVTASAGVAATGNVTATGTVEPAGDTAAGDNAAIGYTAAEGLILTGQGSTNDVTIKNDADADVIEIPTGTTNVTVAGQLNGGTIILAETDTDTSNTGSVTIDFSAHQNFVLTLTGSVTLANPSTESVGQSGVFVFIQDGTGSRTLSLGTDYESPAGGGITLSTAANAVDVVPYFVKASGSIQLGAPQLAFS